MPLIGYERANLDYSWSVLSVTPLCVPWYKIIVSLSLAKVRFCFQTVLHIEGWSVVGDFGVI